MALRNYINTSREGQVLNPIGTGDSTIVLSGTGLVNIPTIPFYIKIDPDTASEEIVLVGSGSTASTLLNCTRGFDGTTAFSHLAGAKVRHCVAAEFYQKADAHVEASTNVHGLSGGAAVVGTTQTQTLTNKTINASVLDLAHSTSPAASQAIKVSADSASSRDGFSWDNTGSSTGRALVVRSGGADKFTVAGQTGNTAIAGTLNVSGLSTTTAITNTGALNTTGAVNITGNIEHLGTLHTSLGVDFDSTLNADGAVTFGSTLGVTGAATVSTLTATTFVSSYGGRTIPSVSSTGDVTSPSTGQVAFQTSDNRFYRWTGSAWTLVLPVPTVEVFTGTGTWTKAAGCTQVLVEVIGGGGSGGGAEAVAGNGASGAGGGAGGYARKLFAASTLAATETVTVGAGGAAATAGANNGNSGGNSSFATGKGYVVTGNGGGGGGGGFTSGGVSQYATGGSGGSASGGDINSPGGAGAHSALYGGVVDPMNVGGKSQIGAGGAAPIASGTGNAGTAYGSGSSGATNFPSTTSAKASTAGAAGLVLVYNFFW